MKIECTLPSRKDTRTVNIGGTNYVFKRKEAGDPLTCDVKDKDHAKVLLSIREGYRKADNQDEPAAPVVQGNPNPVDQRILDTTGQIPGGSTNETSQVDQFVSNPPEKALADMDDEELREVFKTELSRSPNARAQRDTIIAQIEAAREEAAANAAAGKQE